MQHKQGDVSVVESKAGYSRWYQIAIDDNKAIIVNVKESTGEFLGCEARGSYFSQNREWKETRLVTEPLVTPEYTGDIPAITTKAGGAL